MERYFYGSKKRRRAPFQTWAACREPRPAIMTLGTIWLWLAALVFVGVMLPGGPALADDFFIDTNGHKISGRARNALMGDVLGNLAERCGYKVHVDEKLFSVPVTFEIPVALDAEKAIRRIVHPHSYALIFGRVPGRKSIRIEQVKVFSEGSQSASYVLVTGSGGVSRARASYALGGGNGGSGRVSSSVAAGKAALSRHVRPPVEITTNSLGFTGYRYSDRRRGPDYRPEPADLAKAYASYRSKRGSLLRRTDSAGLQSARRVSLAKKSRYRTQRTRSIEQTLNESNE